MLKTLFRDESSIKLSRTSRCLILYFQQWHSRGLGCSPIDIDQKGRTCSPRAKCGVREHLMWPASEFLPPKLENNIASKRNWMTNRQVDSKPRELFLAPWHSFISLFSIERDREREREREFIGANIKQFHTN